MIWDRVSDDEEWDHLLQGLWKYQWTNRTISLTDEFKKVMFEESQGITDIAIKLFMIAQWRAIDQNIDHITINLIRSVAKDRLQLVKEALEALKSGNRRKIAKFSDLYSTVDTSGYFNELQAKYKRQELLDIIQNELGYGQLEQLKNQITNWLVKAGIEVKVAIEAAKQVVEENLEQLESVDLNQEALKKTLLAGQRNIKLDTPISKVKRVKSLPTEIEDLRFVCAKAKEQKITAYDALKKARYIANLKKFWA